LAATALQESKLSGATMLLELGKRRINRGVMTFQPSTARIISFKHITHPMHLEKQNELTRLQ
jgi:hypothetical protein